MHAHKHVLNIRVQTVVAAAEGTLDIPHPPSEHESRDVALSRHGVCVRVCMYCMTLLR